MRRIASDLRPVMLDDLGLVPSIEHVVHTFTERTGVPVELDVRSDGAELGDPLATGVYRIVQEALTNVARHARARAVEVSLHVNGDLLEVSVRDDGIGLKDAPAAGRSHGILGMKERAQTLNELVDLAHMFYGDHDPNAIAPADRDKHLTAPAREAVAGFSQRLAALGASDWTAAGISAALKDTLAAQGLKMPELAIPVRLLVFGVAQTPSVDAMLAATPKAWVLARLARWPG